MKRRSFLAGAAAGGVISTLDWLGYFRQFGVPGTKKELGIAAAGCLLRYARETQRGELPHVSALVPESREDAVALDAASLRNLEIDTNFAGGDDYTLAWVLDTTNTAMGSRWLRRWLRRPLRRLRTDGPSTCGCGRL